MKSRSYAKFVQKGSLSSSFGILSIGFGILAWTVSFTTQEFNSRSNLDALSSIQSRGAVILSLIDQDGLPRDVSSDLQAIRATVGGDGDLCLVYLNGGVVDSSTDIGCEALVSNEIIDAARRAWPQTIVSFDRNSPQVYSLNSVSGPEVASTTRSINTASLEPSCFRIGRGYGCQTPGETNVAIESEFGFAEGEVGQH